MKDNIEVWPHQGHAREDIPKPAKRPCDWGLDLAIFQLESQLGTIEAFNRIVAAAHRLKALIDAGHIRAQHPVFAKSIRGEIAKGAPHDR